MNTITTFVSFLEDQGIESASIILGSNIHDTIVLNYHLLTNSILQNLANYVATLHNSNQINEKNIQIDNHISIWSEILDCIRDITIQNREEASKNFQILMNMSNDTNSQRVIHWLKQIHNENKATSIFRELIQDTINMCMSNNNPNSENIIAMMKFVQEVILRLDLTKEKNSKTIEKNPNKSINVDIIEKKSPDQSIVDIHDNDNQSKLIIAGEYLQHLISEYKGNITQLKMKILEDYNNQIIQYEYLIHVLQDNIDACHAANYINKKKLFEYLLEYLKNIHDKDLIHQNENENYSNQQQILSSTIHAPQFIEENNSLNKDNNRNNMIISSPLSFIDGSNYSMSILENDIKNKKKKLEKKLSKQKVTDLALKLGKHLHENRWVVCDNFLPLDIIRRVRIESSLLQDYYEQSEIWVGKKADIGAHLSVPNIRGDRVLFMCGGNNGSPEGVSRKVTTIGEIEPCKLNIKAVSPIRRFIALRELISACDKLVDEMKLHVKELSGVYERSDAMLAIYPGKGSRFQRHIDNTTGDGRRLTLLIYLNPGWTVDKGGNLRITDKNINENSSVDVLPVAGRLAMFFSSEIIHEVRPCFDDRHAITIWYYDAEERKKAIEEAHKEGKDIEVSTIEAQIEAKNFIAELMGGENSDINIDPKPDEIKLLSEKAKRLSNDALKIVSKITGSISPKVFLEGFELLTTTDLKSMRILFHRMGLD